MKSPPSLGKGEKNEKNEWRGRLLALERAFSGTSRLHRHVEIETVRVAHFPPQGDGGLSKLWKSALSRRGRLRVRAAFQS